MRHYNTERELGTKLIPKLVSTIVQSVIATKKGLAGHEYEVRTRATQEIIDRMGHEAADHFSGLMDKVLAQDNIHPALHEFMAKAASGDDQWQAAGQFIFQSTGIAGALGQAISNAVAPVVYELNKLGPNLDLDPATAAAGLVRGWVGEGLAYSMAAEQGVQSSLFDAMVGLARTFPDAPTLFSLFNRGIISEADALEYLRRNGFSSDLTRPIMQLSQVILSPPDLALAVLREDIPLDEGRRVAQQSGVSSSNFDIILNNTGEPPGADELMEALRRGIIDEGTFKRGILQSRVRNEWVTTLTDLRYSPMSTADAVQAYVQNYLSKDELTKLADQNGLVPGQIDTVALAAGEPLSRTEMGMLVRRGEATTGEFTEALRQSRLKDSYTAMAAKLIYNPPSVSDAIESAIQGYMTKDEAKAIAKKDGLDEQYFDALYLTAGEPLSKTEMLTLYKRKKVSKQQVIDALRQSRLKDSYIDDALELATTLPALYEVRALLSAGAFTAEQGTQILLEQGYSEDIVKAIVKSAIGDTTGTTKALTEAMYADLYQEQAITASEFQQELKALGYTVAQGELIQEVYDQKIAFTNRNAVIAKIRAQYTNRKITETVAQNDLNALGIASTMVDKLMEDWKLILDVTVKDLTPAQVVDAWFMGLFEPGDTAANMQQALQYLNTLGYSGNDAMILLAIKNKGPLTNSDESKQTQSGSNSPPSQSS